MHIINPMRHALSIALLISLLASSLQATTVIVNTSQDADAIAPGTSPVSTLGGGLITLRSAIQYFNAANPGANTIYFDIPTSDPGYNASNNTWTLTPGIPLNDPNIGGKELDPIAVPITINGYTFGGAVYNTSTPNTLAQGDNAVLQIVLNGSNYTVGDGQFTGNGLHFAPAFDAEGGVDGSIVKGLVINEWLLTGILLDATYGSINGIQINGNFIGTNASGTQVLANRCGIGISSGKPATSTNAVTNTVVGTSAVADRNIIAGSFGYFIFDGYNIRGAGIATSSATSTLIQNNYIGTDKNGTTALGNSHCGVLLMSETNSIIGGTSANVRNIISGHAIYGVNLTSSLPAVPTETPGCSGCLVQGNYIGTDLSGSLSLGNSNAGVALDSFSTNNTIGGSVAGAGNLISGNGNGLIPGSGVGIRLGQLDMPGSSENFVLGNKIGVDVTGTKALANRGFGIILNDSQNTVGFATALTRNIISGNGKGGILIYGTNNEGIYGNYIGTDLTGTKIIPNGGNGIQIGANGTIACAGSANFIGH